MNFRTSAFRRLAILSLSALAIGACEASPDPHQSSSTSPAQTPAPEPTVVTPVSTQPNYSDAFAKVKLDAANAQPLGWYADTKNVIPETIRELDGYVGDATALYKDVVQTGEAAKLGTSDEQLLQYRKDAIARLARATYTYILGTNEYVMPNYDGMPVEMAYNDVNTALRDANIPYAEAGITPEVRQQVQRKLVTLEQAHKSKKSATSS